MIFPRDAGGLSFQGSKRKQGLGFKRGNNSLAVAWLKGIV